MTRVLRSWSETMYAEAKNHLTAGGDESDLWVVCGAGKDRTDNMQSDSAYWEVKNEHLPKNARRDE